MSLKQFIYFAIFILIIGTTTVNKTDQCNSCEQMKSQYDCLNYGGCQWNSASNTTIANCTQTQQTPITEISFCSTISSSDCAKTSGCAYTNSTCSLFSGCSAYQMTSLQECQNIQHSCITDGISCAEATDCSQYPQTLCEQTINISGNSCKWDTTTNACRNFECSEASVALNSDSKCDAFSTGCITTGLGCISKPLPQCSSYTGTNLTCPQMKGSDGYCIFNDGTTNCKPKQCIDAPTSTSTDAACNTYQIGCVTTGKGCIKTLGVCSSYTVTNAVTDCKGYIGTDGICEGDSGATVCRSRKCENGTGTTDKACDDYKKGCITNGVSCTVSKSTCNGYQGTITTCPNYIATDGNCKGSSDTVAACQLKDCVTDSQSSYTTDALCKSNIQSWCITTGKGCVKTLSSCTSYTSNVSDGSDCVDLIGSEGKCDAGSSGQCSPRTCTNAPLTYTTNKECSDYFTGCVTTGTGCVTQTSCQNTVTQLTCSGTKEGTSPCTWNSQCVVSTSCNTFTLQSICITSLATIINGNTSYKQACKWDSNQCINASCTDFTGINYQTNDACDTVFPGCVTNGEGCVDPSACSASFKGTKQECLAFKAYCTNNDQATSSDPCVSRACDDSGLSYNTDQDCQNYLSGCTTNGNGCISNTQPCSGYTGTPQECSKFSGYYNGKVKGAKCWNSNATSGSCTEKQCTHASGVNNNSDCDTFLSGCLYDGGTSCVDPSAPCSSYKYTSDASKCQSYKGVNNTVLCYQSTNNHCKNRECTDNITSTTNKDCNTFLSGCRTKGTGCVSSTVPCSNYQGTLNQCNSFVGNSIQCTQLQKVQCAAKLCSGKTDAANHQACMTYKSSCRLSQGGGLCQGASATCIGYTLGAIADSSKYQYCNSITTLGGTNCAYAPNTTDNCVARSSCSQWNTDSGISCVDYLGTSTCSFSSSNNICYAPGACNTYSIPSSVDDKMTFCQNMSPICNYSLPNTTCTTITTCEGFLSPTSSIECNNILKTDQCQYYGFKCYTTQASCTSYSTAGIATIDLQDYCSSFKALNTSDGVILCKYDSSVSSSCSNAVTFNKNQTIYSCEDIVGATSIENCNSFSGYSCSYYKSKCYSQNLCSSLVVSDITDKQTFCQNMFDSSWQICAYVSGSFCSLAGNCADIINPSATQCLQREASNQICKYDSANNQCVVADDSEQCSLISAAQSEDDCISKGSFHYCLLQPFSNTCMSVHPRCSQFSEVGTSPKAITKYCQAINRSSRCTSIFYNGHCTDAPASCSEWNIPSGEDGLQFCQMRITQTGAKCTYVQDSITCSATSLYNSLADCIYYNQGYYANGSCYTQSLNCSSVNPTGADDDAKLTYCNLRYNMNGVQCTFLKGMTACVNKGACATYEVSSLSNKLLACKSIDTTSSTKCSYIGTGTQCLSFADCSSIIGATSQSDCNAFFSNCIYFNSKCYTASSTCNYQTGGSGATAFCNGIKNTNGDYCTAASDTASTCIERTCNDTAASTLNTNADCKAYYSQCKSDGTKCIESAITCYSQQLLDCTAFLDTDNVSSCLSSTGGSGGSSENTCADNTTQCNSYTGTKTVCQTKLGNLGKCNGDSDSVSGQCRNTLCSDLQTATQDSDCDDYYSGCIYNGVGCTDKSQPCSAYYGTIDTCKNFKGINGTTLCWGTSTSIGPCKIKECSDLSGTSDSACQAFLPALSGQSPNCMTDGSKCVTYPRTCSQFTGTTEICSKLTASDGPCKSVSGTCTPRICTEAKLTTDAECKAYHPTCVTNGRACVQSGISCGDIQTGTACNSKLGCVLATSCKVSPGTCNSLTSNGQSACVNTPLASGNKCMWSSTNTCRDFLCTDYDQTITTHQGCQDLDTSCTTSGAGCVKYGTCDSYTTYSICQAANTTESSIRCAWENNKCRQQICTDLKGVSNVDCNKQLTGCKSNGTTCIGTTYSCSVFSGNKSFCVSDSDRNPCIYLNDICYKFNSCSDIPYTDFETCQKVSTNCVPSISNCIPIASCNKYDNQTSCIIGINQTTCGWLSQTNKCVAFGLCSDYAGTTLEDCQSYSTKCVSDGKNCVDVGKCTSYLTSTSCSNAGSDGLCTWDATNVCRLRQCSDLISTTDSSCSAYIVTTGICTTDGQQCVSRAKCTEYKSEAACTIGSDGVPCTFGLPIGQTTGDKSCRVKDCTEITGVTNDICLTAISGKTCVSDGKSCLNQSKCSNYKNQISCNGGGTDGTCAFTPVPTANDTLAGICQLFDQCEKANKDQIACKLNSAACLWNSTINGNTTTTSCSSYTCASKAIGTECYPVPNFNGSQYTICALSSNICAQVDPQTLGSTACYTKSQYTYTWDQTAKTCVKCGSNSQNGTVVNNTANNSNSSDNSTTTFEERLWVIPYMITLSLLA